jgi:DNA topoisomerase IA
LGAVAGEVQHPAARPAVDREQRVQRFCKECDLGVESDETAQGPKQSHAESIDRDIQIVGEREIHVEAKAQRTARLQEQQHALQRPLNPIPRRRVHL